jgi:hypothetical protein
MAIRVDEVLALWRECERVLEQLPTGSVHRRLVTADELELRRLYRRLTTERIVETDAVLRAARETIDNARMTLEEARIRLDGGPGN